MGKSNVKQNPMDYVGAFGLSRMKEIIKEANGREIVFEYKKGTVGGYTYSFKGSKK